MKKGLRWMAVMIAAAGLMAGCAKEAGVDAAAPLSWRRLP